MSSFWNSCLSQFEHELPPQQFNTWIRPLVAVVAHDMSRITIQVGNRFKLDWIRAQYGARIAVLLEKISGHHITLELALAPRGSFSKSMIVASGFEVSAVMEPTDMVVSDDSVVNPLKNRLNTALTFDNLIEGTANRMGRAAAMHVASSLGQLYNPLFIYGGVGLGKTHLMQAIGNEIHRKNPGSKIRYLHANDYIQDVVRASMSNGFDALKKYYNNLDLLLMDDIQFIGGDKTKTQEEFFYTFNNLLTLVSNFFCLFFFKSYGYISFPIKSVYTGNNFTNRKKKPGKQSPYPGNMPGRPAAG